MHAYKEEWTSYEEVMLSLKGEPKNSHDKYVVAIAKDNAIVVGNVSFNLASFLHFFPGPSTMVQLKYVTGP